MRRISYIPLSMRFVAVALGIVMLVLTVAWLWDVFNGRDRSPLELLVFFVSGAVGYGLTWLLHSGLADEVLDGGDHLIVRFGSRSTRVPLTDIESVSESTFTHRGRITLRLWRPGPFGSVIAFVAPRECLTDLMPLARGRIAEDLKERVEHVQRTTS